MLDDRLRSLLASAPVRESGETWRRLGAAADALRGARRFGNLAGQAAALDEILALIDRGVSEGEAWQEVYRVLALRARIGPRVVPPAPEVQLVSPASLAAGARPVLLVGLRRPEGYDRDWGDSVSSRRLERLIGLRPGSLLDAVDACNLLGPEDEESGSALRGAAARIAPSASARRVVLLCGRDVHAAFGLASAPKVEAGGVARLGLAAALLIPHPSGRNRLWNDAAVHARVRDGLRRELEGLIPEQLLLRPAEAGVEALGALGIAPRALAWPEVFLASFAQHGNVEVACREAAVTRDGADWRRAHDHDFALRWRQALARAADAVRAEVRRRGVEGFEEVEERVHPDGLVETKRTRRFSDPCLLRLAAAMMPEFRERVALTVSQSPGPEGMSDAELEAVIEESRRRSEPAALLDVGEDDVD